VVVVEEEQGAVVVVEAGAAAREERGRIRSRVATSSLVARSELGYKLCCNKAWLLLTCRVLDRPSCRRGYGVCSLQVPSFAC
jgi:hypothetical protein